MSRGYEVDVVTAFLLEPDHDACRLGKVQRVPLSHVCDIIVLAEDAAQVAVGEEYGAGAMISDQWRFFPEMGKGAGDFQFCAGPAVSGFAIHATDKALPWAESALFEELIQSISSPSEVSFLVQAYIRR